MTTTPKGDKPTPSGSAREPSPTSPDYNWLDEWIKVATEELRERELLPIIHGLVADVPEPHHRLTPKNRAAERAQAVSRRVLPFLDVLHLAEVHVYGVPADVMPYDPDDAEVPRG